MSPKTAANDEEIEEIVRTADGAEFVLVRPRIRATGFGLVDEREAARIMRKSVRTLQRWRQLKQGPVYHDLHGTIWYKVTSLAEFIETGCVDPLAS